MKERIPAEDKARMEEFLREEQARQAKHPKSESKKARRLAESLKSGKLLTPREAISLAQDLGATTLYGDRHCLVERDGQQIPITLRPQQKTLDPGTCSDLKKFLGL